jgi:CheY-like chemotaxis protein
LKARETMPDLILLDYNMPVMDGYHTLECLKKDPAVKMIPVIMLTTEAVSETVMKLIKLGLKDYITKPFGREDFLKKVNKTLNLFEGDEVPPEIKAAPEPAKAKPTASAAPSIPEEKSPNGQQFLSCTEGIHMLRFPGEQDPGAEDFINALGSKIAAEIDTMSQQGHKQLVMQLSPLVGSSTMALKKFSSLLGYTQRLNLDIRLVAYSERAAHALRKLSVCSNASVFHSLEDAVASLGKPAGGSA